MRPPGGLGWRCRGVWGTRGCAWTERGRVEPRGNGRLPRRRVEVDRTLATRPGGGRLGGFGRSLVGDTGSCGPCRSCGLCWSGRERLPRGRQTDDWCRRRRRCSQEGTLVLAFEPRKDAVWRCRRCRRVRCAQAVASAADRLCWAQSYAECVAAGGTADTNTRSRDPFWIHAVAHRTAGTTNDDHC